MSGTTAHGWKAAARRGANKLRSRGRAHLKSGGRWLVAAGLDARDAVKGDRNPLVPPRRLGLPSPIHGVGKQLAGKVMIDAAGLQPGDRLLDIGCGPGRMAVYLIDYLDAAAGGAYEGFDVVPGAIRWGQREFTPRHPNFRFQLADVRNGTYSPDAGADASEYVFPFPDADFDVTMAASLYTHIFPYQTAQYLRQTARVLRPGGRTAASFFLLNDETERMIADGVVVGRAGASATMASRTLHYGDAVDDGHGGRYRTTDSRAPEKRLAVYEDDVRELYDRAGLEIQEIRRGYWPGRAPGEGWLGQDWVIATRR